MDEPSNSPGDGGTDRPSSDNTVTQNQLESAVNRIQLHLGSLSYNTLDGGQKVNLLAIRTIGIVYALSAAVYFLTAVFMPTFTLDEASAGLQSLLVLFAALYGFVMLISESAKRAASLPPSSTEEDQPFSNEE